MHPHICMNYLKSPNLTEIPQYCWVEGRNPLDCQARGTLTPGSRLPGGEGGCSFFLLLATLSSIFAFSGPEVTLLVTEREPSSSRAGEYEHLTTHIQEIISALGLENSGIILQDFQNPLKSLCLS